jgi:c-di-GMP-binding flagellar brake protein YcgR
MTTSKHDYLERRAFPRYPIRDSSAVMLSPDAIISFRILDISKTGMAFCYNGRKLESKSMDKAFIAFFGEHVLATDIPVRIVFDKEIDKANVWFYNKEAAADFPYLRRCGIKFDNLSKDHEAAIDTYIHDLEAN